MSFTLQGIRVNMVAPGYITTDMTASITGKKRDDVLRRVPLGRFGSPTEVAGAVKVCG